MRQSRSEKVKYRFLFFIIAFTFILLASFITLVINVPYNRGVIPLMFIVLSIYSLALFLYYIICESIVINHVKKYNIKIIYILFFIINVVLSFFSIIVLWI